MKRTSVSPALVDTRTRALVLLAALASASMLGCRPEPLPFGQSSPPSEPDADAPPPETPDTAGSTRPKTSPVDALERKYGGSAFYVPEYEMVLWYGGVRPPHPWDGKATHDDEPAPDVHGFEIYPDGLGLVVVDAQVPAPLMAGGFSSDSPVQLLIGEGDRTPSARVRRFDLLDGSVEDLPPLPAPRLGASIGEGPDGPWVLGGFSEGSIRDDVLHLVDGAWQALPDRLPQPTVGGMLQVHQERVILWNADSNKSTKQHLIRGASASGWHTVTLPEPPFEGSAYGDGATLVGFERQIFGLPGPWQPTPASVSFDPSTEKPQKIASFPKECGHNAAKAVVVEDRVLVLGVVLDLAAKDSEINIYPCWLDPKTGTFSVADRAAR